MKVIHFSVLKNRFLYKVNMTNEECNNSRKCMGNVSLLLESKGIMNLGYLFVKLLLRTGRRGCALVYILHTARRGKNVMDMKIHYFCDTSLAPSITFFPRRAVCNIYTSAHPLLPVLINNFASAHFLLHHTNPYVT